ncbi:ABC transporter ATP-binding protein [Microbacterium betulae]|uniref:ABC transporter ATP-binding protein n=1 Tax=Microbacterium betulae TaxID=2981139 RepID=A0AA97I6L7_9MICO|nr:ABC transporter ATP-binding protein [Microbacterium sp. AB]WOF22560.1 ABC transporter ATP-binding protein [Microbacterium sp. AB]
MSTRSPILAARGLRKTFGGFTAVDVESFEVPRGEVTALIGPNGAGKTTLFDLVSGFVSGDTGTIEFDGRAVQALPAHKRARLGLVRTFQLTRLFNDLDAVDNLLVGTLPAGRIGLAASTLRPFRSRRDLVADRERALAELERVGLTPVAHIPVGKLSGGQRKLVEFARALMAEPTALLLDEPFAGVNPSIREDMMRYVNAFVADGGTVLLVEHDLPRVMQIAQRVVVLDRGAVISTGTPAEVTADQRVIDAYIGKRRA